MEGAPFLAYGPMSHKSDRCTHAMQKSASGETNVGALTQSIQLDIENSSQTNTVIQCTTSKT